MKDFSEHWASMPENEKQIIRDSALEKVDCDSMLRNDWLAICMAYKAAGGDMETLFSWCARHKQFKDIEVTPAWWNGLKVQPGQFRALTKAAESNGWKWAEALGKTPETGIKTQKNAGGGGMGIPRENAAETAKQRQFIRKIIEEAQRQPDEAFNYMVQQRGISEETCKRFGVGTYFRRDSKTGETVAYCLIPYPGLDFYNARNMAIKADTASKDIPGGKCRKPFDGEEGLFNREALTAAAAGDVVFFTEGEIDCMSIEQQGFRACSGKPGDLEKALQETGTKAAAVVVVEDVDEPRRDRDGKILLDKDGEAVTPGSKAAKKALDVLTAAGVHGIRVKPEQGKDSNAFLLDNPGRFAEWLTEAAEAAGQAAAAEAEERRREYQEQYQTAGQMEAFKAWFKHRPGAISTGFAALDRALDGGLYPELYVIGAISSLGKTALVMQIADNIAAAGTDVLIISLEMGKYELQARSISRITTEKNGRALWQRQHEVERGGSNEAAAKVIREAMEEYFSVPGRYIIEGEYFSVQQIREAVRRHVEITGRKPVLILDYLQLIAPLKGHERDSDKQQMDTAVKALKYLVNNYAIPVIAISSFNRANYAVPVGMEAFKESGCIEYSSGVLLGMQLSCLRGTKTHNGVTGETKREIIAKDYVPPIDEEKAKPDREIDVVVLKQRAGQIGTVVEFVFHAGYSAFEEVGGIHKYSAVDNPPEIAVGKKYY